jgi:hypothetical protein
VKRFPDDGLIPEPSYARNFARAHIEPALIAFGVAQGYGLDWVIARAAEFFADRVNEPIPEPGTIMREFAAFLRWPS